MCEKICLSVCEKICSYACEKIKWSLLIKRQMSLTTVTDNTYICPYLCIFSQIDFFYLQITLYLFESRGFICKADCICLMNIGTKFALYFSCPFSSDSTHLDSKITRITGCSTVFRRNQYVKFTCFLNICKCIMWFYDLTQSKQLHTTPLKCPLGEEKSYFCPTCRTFNVSHLNFLQRCGDTCFLLTVHNTKHHKRISI